MRKRKAASIKQKIKQAAKRQRLQLNRNNASEEDQQELIKSKKPNCVIQRLPNDLLALIFQFLNANTIVCLRRVSKKFQHVVWNVAGTWKYAEVDVDCFPLETVNILLSRSGKFIRNFRYFSNFDDENMQIIINNSMTILQELAQRFEQQHQQQLNNNAIQQNGDQQNVEQPQEVQEINVVPAVENDDDAAAAAEDQSTNLRKQRLEKMHNLHMNQAKLVEQVKEAIRTQCIKLEKLKMMFNKETLPLVTSNAKSLVLLDVKGFQAHNAKKQKQEWKEKFGIVEKKDEISQQANSVKVITTPPFQLPKLKKLNLSNYVPSCVVHSLYNITPNLEELTLKTIGFRSKLLSGLASNHRHLHTLNIHVAFNESNFNDEITEILKSCPLKNLTLKNYSCNKNLYESLCLHGKQLESLRLLMCVEEPAEVDDVNRSSFKKVINNMMRLKHLALDIEPFDADSSTGEHFLI